eukprot:3530892-Pyramimonas_sp.AAC.1
MESPKAWKRVIFIGLVQGSLLSGLQPFILSDKQHTLLDKHLARLGRTAMMGAACTHALEDDDHARSLATREVLDYWGITDCFTELLARRLH